MNHSATVASPIVKRSKKKIRQRLFRSEATDTLPVVIRHERIYILPTGRGMAFLGVIMIMLLASMNYRLNLGYALTFILIGLFASSLLSTYLNLVKLVFVKISAADTFAGTPVEFDITITEPGNRCRHSIEISAANSTAQLDINKAGTSTARLTTSSLPRGVHSLGRITLSSDFPLGLWRGWGYVHAESQAYVYPAPEKPATPLTSAQSGTGHAHKFSEEREFKELRNYQPTDSPSAIAWKTVARGGGWFTKEFETVNNDNCDIDIRWQDTDKTLSTEQRLSRLCAWLVEAEKSSAPCRFELPDYASQSQQKEFDFYKKCLRRLATFNPSVSPENYTE